MTKSCRIAEKGAIMADNQHNPTLTEKVQSGSTEPPATLVSKLDVYSKVVIPTVQVAIALAAIVVAYQVFVVQREGAERSKAELSHRIDKLQEFNSRLESQTTLLRHHTETLKEQHNIALHQLA